jgi:predicted amidohydrolase YtcJ
MPASAGMTIRGSLIDCALLPAATLVARINIILLLFVLIGCSGRGADYSRSAAVRTAADIVLRGGKIITVDNAFSITEAVAIWDGRFVAVGRNGEIRDYIGPHTRVIELDGRTVIPGLIDSHIHATVAGLGWDAELHWEKNRTLADGLRQIAAAAKSKKPGSWIVIGGGWVPTQFVEQRFPTQAELDAIAPKNPVYVQYLRQGALLNSAALAAIGITRQTADPAGGRIEKNPSTGALTGWLQGVAAWQFAYNQIGHYSFADARQSLRNCFRELNRLAITSVADMQTGGVNFTHRRLLADMARTGELSLRLNYYIAPNEPGDELEQLKLATEEIQKLSQSGLFRFAGFGETLVRGLGDGDVLANPHGVQISAQAKEKFRAMLSYFAETGSSFQLHTTQDQTARQLLDVIEQVHATTPLTRQRIVFAHLEDATAETIARIKNLGGGVAVQDRLALTAERNVELWGEARTRRAPPLRTMLDSRIPVGAGTDAFRSANYSPMLSLWWLISGKTVAGSAIRDATQNVTRAEALRMYTLGSAWITADEARTGSIEVGKFADLAVLSADYLTVPEEQVRNLESLLTMVGGRIVYAAGPYTASEAGAPAGAGSGKGSGRSGRGLKALP